MADEKELFDNISDDESDFEIEEEDDDYEIEDDDSDEDDEIETDETDDVSEGVPAQMDSMPHERSVGGGQLKIHPILVDKLNLKIEKIEESINDIMTTINDIERLFNKVIIEQSRFADTIDKELGDHGERRVRQKQTDALAVMTSAYKGSVGDLKNIKSACGRSQEFLNDIKINLEEEDEE